MDENPAELNRGQHTSGVRPRIYPERDLIERGARAAPCCSCRVNHTAIQSSLGGFASRKTCLCGSAVRRWPVCVCMCVCVCATASSTRIHLYPLYISRCNLMIGQTTVQFTRVFSSATILYRFFITGVPPWLHRANDKQTPRISVRKISARWSSPSFSTPLELEVGGSQAVVGEFSVSSSSKLSLFVRFLRSCCGVSLLQFELIFRCLENSNELKVKILSALKLLRWN